jgi:hypothetical protein
LIKQAFVVAGAAVPSSHLHFSVPGCFELKTLDVTNVTQEQHTQSLSVGIQGLQHNRRTSVLQGACQTSNHQRHSTTGLMPVDAQANRDYSWRALIPCNHCRREHKLHYPTSHHVDQITCFPNEFDGTETGYTAWWYIYSNTQHFAQWAVKWRCSPTAASLTKQNQDLNVSDPQ